MTKLEYLFLSIAILAVLVSLVILWWSRRQTKRTLTRVDAMLTAAMDGSFRENIFDESLLSAVETKLAHYLASSAVSARNLTAEKEKIQELIADISHQTKTPIANILLYAQLLAEQSLPEGSSACVKALNQQAEKLSFLIGSLVKTSRLETGIITVRPQRQKVMPLLEAVVQQIRPKATAKQISITCEPTAAFANMDGRWTAEAIYNIVDNAVKYTPRSGQITISTSVYNLFCRIDITDNGMGIAEEEQAKIFGRFYRSAAVGEAEGVGIGLYLSRQIISGEGGYIKVTSKVGSGATFSVFLPLDS